MVRFPGNSTSGAAAGIGSLIMSNRAVRFSMSGFVQGCGVRPALAKLATRHGWSGSVRNTTDGVELILVGELPDFQLLADQLRAALPRQAVVTRFVSEPWEMLAEVGFSIEPSMSGGDLRRTYFPRDTAICHACLAETWDITNRRYRYPFTTCAECGPRFSILLGMPFDRERTTMNAFSMCDQCRGEYDDPSDRRFHAQTICCPECGPHVWSTDSDGMQRALRDEAIYDAVGALKSEGIVCVRGVGGYQFLADATSEIAVCKLRDRKCRPAKPFAVLCRDLTAARALATFNDIEAEQLICPQNTIVLVRQRSESGLAASLNPGLSDIGLMLPTTSLHDRIARLAERPLVCTSANVEGEPLEYQVEDAECRLRNVADLFLHHNREIARPIDDSVIRVIAYRPVTIRCGRGLAPLPLPLTTDSANVAVGGHQKSAISLSRNGLSLLGPHVGDLDTVASCERWSEQLHGLLSITTSGQQGVGDRHEMSSAITLKHAQVDRVIHDHHPEYFPTQVSQHAEIPKVVVWHHHAHIAAGLLEHQWLDRTVLGVAFDGTGLGPDGTVWGGEFLISSASRFSRVAHLRPFGLPGGEAAITDLRRTAVSLLSQLVELSHEGIADLTGVTLYEVAQNLKLLTSSRLIRTSSCGRLFDAVACLILQHHRAAFEGQGAMCLESRCDTSHLDAYSFEVGREAPFQVDWRPVLRQVVADRVAGVPSGAMAMRFHRGLAAAIIDVCRHWPDLPVVLGGGVFQNRILVELLVEAWPADRAPLAVPGVIPPNDGGLAAGQLVVANALATERG